MEKIPGADVTARALAALGPLSSFKKRDPRDSAANLFDKDPAKRPPAEEILATIDRAPPGFRAYNLGSGAPIRLDALVELIGRAAGIRPILRQEAVPLGDVDATFADISRARDELKWRPLVPLEAGLRSVLTWVRNNSGSPRG